VDFKLFMTRTQPDTSTMDTLQTMPFDPMATREHIPLRIYDHSSEANRAVAAEIAALIRERAAEGKTCVLGLATGHTPVGVYSELVRLHREEGLSFANVVTYNLDEYFPMQPNELQSYV